MAYGESNDHLTDDVTWPRNVKLETPIRLESNIVKTAGRCYLSTVANYYSLLWGGILSAASDSLASI